MNSALKVLLDHWGIEPMEEFGIEDSGKLQDILFRFDQEGRLQRKQEHGRFKCEWEPWIECILSNPSAKVIKLPFEPKCGERYYRPIGTLWDAVEWSIWHGSATDHAIKAAGMLFRTEKACQKALPKLREKYLGVKADV